MCKSGFYALAIALGDQHTCALRNDGRIVCWGTNEAGQLGLGNTASVGKFPGQMGNSLIAVDLPTGTD